MDITLTSGNIYYSFRDWRVLDYRFIDFSLCGGNNTVEAIRNPRNTNWDLYDRLVSLCLDPLTHCRIDYIYGLEAIVAKFTKIIVGVFDKACPKSVNRGEENHPGGTAI